MTAIALPTFAGTALISGSLSRAIADLNASWARERPDDDRFATSVSVDETRRATFLALDAIRIEAAEEGWDGYGASPVFQDTVAQAISFLRLLPTRVPVPDVSASPSGEISFHWSTSPNRVVSVAVSAAGRLTYASLVGDSRNFGSEALSDELPQSIALSLQKVLGLGSER